jgi:hypothetical protein
MQPVSASGDLEWQRMRSDSLQPLSYSHSVCSKESTSAQQPLSLTRAAGIALGTTHSPPAATSCDVSNSPPSFRERVPTLRDSERSKVQSHGLRLVHCVPYPRHMYLYRQCSHPRSSHQPPSATYRDTQCRLRQSASVHSSPSRRPDQRDLQPRCEDTIEPTSGSTEYHRRLPSLWWCTHWLCCRIATLVLSLRSHQHTSLYSQRKG